LRAIVFRPFVFRLIKPLSARDAFTDVNDALSNAVDTAGGDVVFKIGADIITIEDTTIADITDNLII